VSGVADVSRPDPDELEALRAENARLRAAQAELVNATRMSSMGLLVAGIAHELNTPLGALRSNRDVLSRALARLQEILADEVVDASELADVRRIVAAVNGVVAVDEDALARITAIVASLGGYAEGGRSDVELLDVRAALDSALSLLEHERGPDVAITRDYGAVPLVECLGGQLHQVFLNLLRNAFQAVGQRGTITVRAHAPAEEVVVTVEDTGPGIPPQYLERIFQGGFTTKGARVGMGLGLLISSQIVERHRGRIGVRSEVGRGSAFLVHLPLGAVRPGHPGRPAQTETTPAPPASPSDTSAGGPR